MKIILIEAEQMFLLMKLFLVEVEQLFLLNKSNNWLKVKKKYLLFKYQNTNVEYKYISLNINISC